MKKRWSPKRAALVISESGALPVFEQVQREAWESWAQKEVEEFKGLPFVVSRTRRPKFKTFISIITA